jgi:RNA polymerase sigma-70 factor (ECF subfamily)
MPKTGGVVRGLPFEGDDAALVAALREGRADAAAAFYDANARPIHALVFRLLGPDPELEDVVHEVFVRALESLDRLRDPSALRSWIYGIGVFTARIWIQRRTRGRWLRFMAPDEVPEPTSSFDPETAAVMREVYTILGGLAVDERIAFVLCRVEKLTLEEAARASEMSVATLRRRLASGEAKFFARAARRPAVAAWLAESEGETP